MNVDVNIQLYAAYWHFQFDIECNKEVFFYPVRAEDIAL
jgi:hypothetical protein